MSRSGWIGYDLDGTLAVYNEWIGPEIIGIPIEPMVRQVKVHLAAGIEVRIFTARLFPITSVIRHSTDLPHLSSGMSSAEATAVRSANAIFEWSRNVFGRELPITCVKDFDMLFLYDDRCRRVETNSGRLLG